MEQKLIKGFVAFSAIIICQQRMCCLNMFVIIRNEQGYFKDLQIQSSSFFLRDMSVKTELLQEKADDLERVKRYAGAEQIDTIIGKVKEQERMEQQARQYNRSYGAR